MRRLALLLVLTACTSESTGIQNVVCTPGSALTYGNFGEQFIGDHCLECHAADEKPLLNTQAQVHANTRRILEQTVYTTQMPEDEDMSISDRQTLGEWLACGAP